MSSLDKLSWPSLIPHPLPVLSDLPQPELPHLDQDPSSSQRPSKSLPRALLHFPLFGLIPPTKPGTLLTVFTPEVFGSMLLSTRSQLPPSPSLSLDFTPDLTTTCKLLVSHPVAREDHTETSSKEEPSKQTPMVSGTFMPDSILLINNSTSNGRMEKLLIPLSPPPFLAEEPPPPSTSQLEEE